MNIDPSEVRQVADLYYKWKKIMDESGHLIHPDHMTQEEKEMHHEFMQRIAPLCLHEQELCKDDEYLWGPFDFVRGCMLSKTYPFDQD